VDVKAGIRKIAPAAGAKKDPKSMEQPDSQGIFDSSMTRRYNSPLMSRPPQRLPVEVDPFRLAQAGRILEGSLALQQMKRLQPLLISDEGDVEVALEFGIDGMGVHYLRGQLRAPLALVCQRCLEPLSLDAELRVELAFVHNAVQAEAIPAPYEPYVVEATPLMLVDILEEELLLFLPPIPRHELAECAAQDRLSPPDADTEIKTQTPQRDENPFSVLENLKKPIK